jgi:formylmethanofuran dehydrogenase subunit E
MDDIIEKIADSEMRSQIEKVASFHGYLSTGAFAGIQMLNLARKVLCASNKDRLFVTCETYNCLPDSFQVLAGCTVGNKGLKILDHGKMAVTVTRRASAGTIVKGVRVMLDPAKTAKYPRLHAWFMKTEKIPHPEAISILLSASESVYTYKILDLEVPEKPRKKIAICECCKESFVQRKEEMLCVACLDHSQKELSMIIR